MRLPAGRFVSQALILGIFTNLVLLTSSNDADEGAGEIAIQDGTIPPLLEPPNATAIIDKIFVDYDRRLRPFYGGEPVKIFISMGFISISNIIEENMEFEADIYMRQFWKDPRLSYGDRNLTLTFQGDTLKKLWFPDTYFENSKKTFVHEDTRTVILFGDGNLLYSARMTVIAIGTMDFRNYPMDVQVFFFRTLSYGFDISQITYKWINAQLYSSEMTEFYVTKKTITAARVKYMIGWFDYLDVSFIVQRRIGHYVIRIFFPCILCTVVSWLPFWMEHDDIGDRGALGITSLLTEVFLLQYSNDSMPRVSYVKAADLFLIVSFAFTFMALLESVAVFKCIKRAETRRQKYTVPSQEVLKVDDMVDGANTNPAFRTEEKYAETRSDLIELKEPQENKRELEKVNGKKGNAAWHPEYKTSVPSKIAKFLNRFKCNNAKTNLSYVIDRSSRILFPLMYFGFIAFFFGYYGI
ncbi:gamma-aminobutyric acid receptor subunit beta-2-like isoform X1 [Acropora muricata]|uniref:gamma-aminobutyric acid receptor subunit beta-2-like isoform X1 n=1 Tax=Acropora muricata TaxID=159855 RepID=UPI0034E3D6D9